MLRSKILSLANRVHFYSLLVLFLYLPFIHYMYSICLVVYIIYLIKTKLFNKSFIIVSVIFLSLFILRFSYKSHIDFDKEFRIISVESKDDYNKIYAKRFDEKIIIYDANKKELIPGDDILFNGEIKDISNFSDFDYKTYMKSHNIFKTIYAKDIKFIRHNHDLYYLRYKISEIYRSLDYNQFVYFNSLILGNNLLDNDLKDNVNLLGISYMFVVSGFHISLLAYFIDKLLNRVKNQLIKDILIDSILTIYLIFTLFSLGILRAVLSHILKDINKHKNYYLTRLDIISFTFLIVLMINPLYIFRTSFKFSFITSFFIIIAHDLITTKNKLLNKYLITILCFASTLPLVVNMNGYVNLLSLIISPILLMYLTYIVMPLLVLLLINPNFYNLFKAPFNLFSFVISKLSSINNLLIHVKELNPIFIIIFYLLLFYTLVEIEEKKSFKKRFIFLIYISSLILLNKNYISYVSMINVSQGDSFLVNDNNKYLVIDSYNSNIEYIEKENVKEIDTMIITHSDNDHIGSALELAKRHYINNLYFNYYETSDIAKELTKYAKRTRYLKKGDIVYFGKNRIDVLGPIKESDNINNNSLVFILNFKGKKILFTGDSELEEEMDIYDKNYDVDIVKIAHHGSKTSTSDYFMNHVSFDTALISVGENNKYNHPDIETINKLKGKEIYMTKDMNSVKIYFYQNKCFIYPSIYNKILLSTLDKLTRPLFNFKI